MMNITGGGGMSHDVEKIIKQEVEGIDFDSLQSSRISADSRGGINRLSSDHMNSVDSTTYLQVPNATPVASPSPQSLCSPQQMSLHQHQQQQQQQQQQHHHQRHQQHNNHLQHVNNSNSLPVHNSSSQHQQQLTRRDYQPPYEEQIPSQEQALRTSQHLYEEIINGYGESFYNIVIRLFI